jgi:hypothetical protein
MRIAARASTFFRRAEPIPFIFWSSVFMASTSFLLQTGQMAIKPFISSRYELPIKSTLPISLMEYVLKDIM